MARITTTQYDNSRIFSYIIDHNWNYIVDDTGAFIWFPDEITTTYSDRTPVSTSYDTERYFKFLFDTAWSKVVDMNWDFVWGVSGITENVINTVYS